MPDTTPLDASLPQAEPTNAAPGADAAQEPTFPLLAAAELQDHLMSVTNDLERLQRLVDDAGDTLSTHFFAASAELQQIAARVQEQAGLRPGDLAHALNHLALAVTALQFQDMSTQLIAHTSQRLRACADMLARDTFGDDDGETAVVEPPLRPNPVTQDEVDAGSVELF